MKASREILVSLCILLSARSSDADFSYSTRAEQITWVPNQVAGIQNDGGVASVKGLTLLSGNVVLAPIWSFTQPESEPGASARLFSEPGSATSFTSTSGLTTPPGNEEVQLTQRFFPAFRDMAWANDCPTGLATDATCTVHPVIATTLYGARSPAAGVREILLVPDVKSFTDAQSIATGPTGPIQSGSGDYVIAGLSLQQSLFKGLITSGRTYNATWFIRSPGLHPFPEPPSAGGANARLVGFEMGYSYIANGTTTVRTEYVGGATAGCAEPNLLRRCLDRQTGCPIRVRVPGPGFPPEEPGSATLYLNNGTRDADASFTPFSFSFAPGSLEGRGSPWDAAGCEVDGQEDKGMNFDLCQPAPPGPQGTWQFVVTTQNWQGSLDTCGNVSPPVSCEMDRASASLYVDGLMLTSGRGRYRSPVFDSLSQNTQWKRLEWELDMNLDTNGRRRTPIQLGYQTTSLFTNSAAFGGAYTPRDSEETGSLNFAPSWSSTVQGRFFQYEGRLFSWDENPFPVGAPNTPPQVPASWGGDANYCVRYDMRYDGSVNPKIRKMRIVYVPDAGEFITRPVDVPNLRRWNSLTYTADPGGGRVQVDVLGPNGVPAFTRSGVELTDVISGVDLKGLDPGRYPAIKVRFLLDREGNPSANPNVSRFDVNFQSMESEQCLALNRNIIRLSRAERVDIRFCASAPGEVVVKVHDAAGQIIRRIFSGEIRDVTTIEQRSWDGLNQGGEAVAPGVYFISVVSPGGRRTSSVAVSQ